ncbi:hypothetical protein ACFQY5_37620 [Paeniroseomonas aquatica]|uniref:Uncharacterized protein n=1 Tax=Paeniroseomonas aquatica TaxID=373043 RepID=A0ABT7ZZV9_9PROT|nr:hypothetical protein [Paeniroseomonas aquatica]MDN3562998.1 hypothetical protein [Paeniroseomonas aquatica]
MTRGAALAFAALLGLPCFGLTNPAAAEPQDIPWFKAHPEQRRALLLRCHNDVALAQTRECQNAELAGTGAELGVPTRRGANGQPIFPPVPVLPEFQPWPRTRNADRGP